MTNNFSFLNKYNVRLFKLLNEAESKVRINYLESGKFIREALEVWVNEVIKLNQLQKELEQASLNDKIKYLQYYKVDGKRILPYINKVETIKMNGTKEEFNAYDYIRIYGNMCTHAKKEHHGLILSYDAIIKSLCTIHEILSKYYSKNYRYRMDLIRIGKYQIIEHFEQNEEYERYLAYDQNLKRYALIQLFKKDCFRYEFLLRNKLSFVEVCQHSVMMNGFTQFEELTNLDEEYSDYYIMANVFVHKPILLSSFNLANLTIIEKMKISMMLMKTLAHLHNLKQPIYHRGLTPDCICICEYDDMYFPYIVKFEYAKVSSLANEHSVFLEVKQMEKRMKNRRYRPLHIDLDESDEQKDLYALGMIMLDLFKGDFKDYEVDYGKLYQNDVPNRILEVLDAMTCENATCRMKLNDAIKVFESEIAKQTLF